MTTNSVQFMLFKDSLARRLLALPGLSDPEDDSSSDLDDFTSYLASEVWPALPISLREASYEKRADVPNMDTFSLDHIPTSFVDTLVSCGLVDDSEAAIQFLRKTLRDDYLPDAIVPPPAWSKTRTTECEICEREVPLTYHHLIPRETHAKVLKKKWHPEHMLNSVAWLCR